MPVFRGLRPLGADVPGPCTICKPAGHAALHADRRNAPAAGRDPVCEVCDRFSSENVPESGHHIRRVPADDGSSGSGESDAEFAAAVLI